MSTCYHALFISATLMRGEYRHLPDGNFLACCWGCGQNVETVTFDPIAAHGCIPTPDIEEAAEISQRKHPAARET